MVVWRARADQSPFLSFLGLQRPFFDLALAPHFLHVKAASSDEHFFFFPSHDMNHLFFLDFMWIAEHGCGLSSQSFPNN